MSIGSGLSLSENLTPAAMKALQRSDREYWQGYDCCRKNRDLQRGVQTPADHKPSQIAK